MITLGARIWPWVPVGLLGCMLLGLATMATIATRDPGFALERDYYQKAVGYDRVIAQRGENARLDWKVEAAVERVPTGSGRLVVELRDERGPVTGARGSVEALRNATAATPLDLALVEREPGRYEGLLPAPLRGGLWEFRLTFERGTDRFTAVDRRDVPESSR